MIDNPLEFVNFLIEAKQNTYAGDGPHAEPSRPGSKDLHYRSGEYTYIDSYVGDLDFIGGEVVWQGDQPVWGMNYYGRMLTSDIPDGFSQCLKGALKAVPPKSPFRGPKAYQQDEFEYRCDWRGDLHDFRGQESIFYQGEWIYTLYFDGGMLR